MGEKNYFFRKGTARMQEENSIEQQETALRERLRHIEKIEEELSIREKSANERAKSIKDKEKALKESEKAKKQVLLRLAPSLWEALAEWAEEDFRSINGQIEFLLSEAVRSHKKK